MADSFVTIPFTSDAQTLADDYLDRLSAVWGTSYNDGDPEVVVGEALAPMAQNAAEVASQLPPAAFRAIMRLMVGIPYATATPATGDVTFEFADSDPHTVYAGDQIEIDGYAFTVDDDATDTTPLEGVAVTAVTTGSALNGLAGDLVLPITSMAFVATITLDAPTAGGTDAETDVEFQDKAARRAELMANTVVTPRDLETFIVTGDYGAARAIAIADEDARDIDIYAVDENGDNLTSGERDAIEAAIELVRMTTWSLTLQVVNYENFPMAYTVVLYPGVEQTDAKARIEAALRAAISKATWGIPTGSETSSGRGTWLLQPVVYAHKVVQIIGSVEGVDRVESVTLGAGGTPDDDFTLTGGVVVLPVITTITGTVS